MLFIRNLQYTLLLLILQEKLDLEKKKIEFTIHFATINTGNSNNTKYGRKHLQYTLLLLILLSCDVLGTML